MGDVGADDTHDGQARVEDDQRHRAQRAGADGGERDQHAQDETDQDGDPGRAVEAGFGEFAVDLFYDDILEQQHGGADEQRHAEGQRDYIRHGFAGDAEMRDQQQTEDGGRDGACREAADDLPVHGFAGAVDGGADGFGGGGEEQVGA